MNLNLWLTLTLSCVAMVSCGLVGNSSNPEEQKNQNAAGLEAYKQAGGQVGGFEAAVSGGGEISASVSSSSIAAESDIVWAPEDVNVPMPGGLEQLWKQPENKSWNTSFIEATKLSRQSGKPMLIWFTDSARSPLCRKLSDDLFSNSGFDTWASQRLVRVRMDDFIKVENRGKLGMGEFDDLKTRKKNYIDKLKKRYKVSGNPTVLILSPRGAVVARYRGYKKDSADYYWSRIKRDVSKAEDDYGVWREKLEKRGYRMWTSRDGRKTFAKLSRYRSGKVILTDPDGHRGTASFRKLSDADQVWVMLEKKKYEARRRR